MNIQLKAATLCASVWILCCGCAASGGSPAPSAPAGSPAPAQATPSPAPAEPGTPDGAAVAVPPELRAVIDAPDRSPEDRELDAGRRPGELLAFFGVRSGMKVAEIVSSRGYTTELLARAVGPTGVVYGTNPPVVLEKFAEKPWTERLARPAMKNVVRVDREIDAPLPPEATDVDLVVSVLVYHDLFWLGGDRDKMNRAIFAALKPGGAYVVIDHSGRPGTGSSEVQTLHRIEESVVRAEVERAGFQLAEEGAFLRNAADPRDWNASPRTAGERRGESDRFALKFVKPG